MKIEMTSPAATTLQLYYQTPNSPNFQEKMHLSKGVVKGANVIYLSLPQESVAKPMRLDLGKLPGEYTISSIEVRHY